MFFVGKEGEVGDTAPYHSLVDAVMVRETLLPSARGPLLYHTASRLGDIALGIDDDLSIWVDLDDNSPFAKAYDECMSNLVRPEPGTKLNA